MTWEEIQKAALDKVFSRTNYGVEVALDSADVADYVKAMPKAARFAMIDLAEVMPIYRSVEQELPERADGYRLFRVRELAPDFMRLCPDRLTVMGKSTPHLPAHQRPPVRRGRPAVCAGELHRNAGDLVRSAAGGH